MESGPLSTPDFAALAERVVLFAHLGGASSRPGLLREKGGEGTPYFVFLDPAGDVIAPQHGPNTVDALERTRGHAQRYLELSAAEDPSREDEVELLVTEVRLRRVDPAEARERRDAIEGLTDTERRRVDAALSDRRVMDAWYEATPRSQRERAALGERFHRMYQEGCRPARQRAVQAFYLVQMVYAEQEGSVRIYERSLEELRAWMENRGASTAPLRKFERRLEALRAREDE